MGGEAVDPKWFTRLFRSGYRGRLVNAYGPTEATTFSICNVVDAWQDETLPVPIGGPIANSTAYILGRGLSLVPPGAVGEIYVGGDGIALEYINDPRATRERFVESPFAAGERYRTGDLGRYRPNGEIQCLGRTDRQLKIRGYRIEPGEIEAMLESHPEVRQAAVAGSGKESADRTLLAYVVRTDAGSISGVGLQEWLKTRLPAYLLPSRIILLEALPLTANGKLDVSILPAAGDSGSDTPLCATRILTPIESLVIECWKRVLQVEQLEPEDDFFESGGTSFSAIRMLADLERTLQRRVPVALVLQTSTVQGFARSLEPGATSPLSKRLYPPGTAGTHADRAGACGCRLPRNITGDHPPESDLDTLHSRRR